jgi:hypothetical protein
LRGEDVKKADEHDWLFLIKIDVTLKGFISQLHRIFEFFQSELSKMNLKTTTSHLFTPILGDFYEWFCP